MATLIACADGNLTSSATWKVTDSTSLLVSQAGSTACPSASGASARSATFTPGAITIDAIALRIASRSASPSGTMTVRLWTTAAVTGSDVTINVSDLPNATNSNKNDGGFIVFKLAAPITLIAATAYAVEAFTSVAAMVTLWTNGTANNWVRALRTTTTQAPAAADNMWISGEYTGAGAITSRTVTMDSTATTQYGSNPGAANRHVTPGIAIGKGGTLTFGTTASTNYVLRLQASLVVCNGGTLNMGTVATPVPRTSTAILEFAQSTADADYGLFVCEGATWIGQGLSRTSGKNIPYCLLTADVAASGGSPSSSTISVDTDTGWLSGDVVAIAGTGVGSSGAELCTLSGDAGASSMVLNNCTNATTAMAVPPTGTRGLNNAHGGVYPLLSEVVLLTRNVKVRSTSTTLMSYVLIGISAVSCTSVTVDLDWVEFYYHGAASTNFRGFEIEVHTGSSVSVQYCSFHQMERNGVTINDASSANNDSDKVQVRYNCFFNSNSVASTDGHSGIWIGASARNTWDISYNWLIYQAGSGGYNISLGDNGGTCIGNRCANSRLSGISLGQTSGQIGRFEDNVVHSCDWDALVIQNAATIGKVKNFLAYHTINHGVEIFSLSTGAVWVDVEFDTLNLFGCGRSASTSFPMKIAVQAIIRGNDWKIRNTSTNSTATLGFNMSTGTLIEMFVDGLDMSDTTGVYRNFATADLDIDQAGTWSVARRINIRNGKFGSGIPVQGAASMSDTSFVSVQRYGGTTGSHRKYMRNGMISSDATIYKTALPSERMTPNSPQGPTATGTNGQRHTTSTSGVTTNLSNIIEIASSTNSAIQFLKVGRCVSGTGIPAGAYITAVDLPNNQATISANATATGSGLTLTFYDKMESGHRLVPVGSGLTKTVAVYVRTSVSGDGTAYAGAPPRLIMRRNAALGITTDTVCATATSASSGAWEQLSYTTPTATDDGVWEFYVDCVGTAGWVNVDDWSVV